MSVTLSVEYIRKSYCKERPEKRGLFHNVNAKTTKLAELEEVFSGMNWYLEMKTGFDTPYE